MQNSEFNRVLGNVSLTKDEKAKILDKVLRGKSKRVNFNKYLAIAAVLALLVSTIVFSQFIGNKETDPYFTDGDNIDNTDTVETTPKNDYDNPDDIDKEGKILFTLADSGFGYSAILALGKEDLENKNPWTVNMEIESLPIYKNDFNMSFWDSFANNETNDVLAREIAEKLGVKILRVSDTSYECEQGVTIRVDPDGIIVRWDNPVKLPKISESEEYAKQVKYLEHFYSKYEGLFGFQKPEFEVTVTYNYDGGKNYNLYVFDNNGTDDVKVENYSMRKAYLAVSEDGLSILRIPRKVEYEKVGEFPIISKDQAIENFLAGKYLTTIPFEEDITLEKIAKVELVYYYNQMAELFQPVYVAYIKLENTGQTFENGLIEYGLYFTPAITDEYVAISEVHFN